MSSPAFTRRTILAGLSAGAMLWASGSRSSVLAAAPRPKGEDFSYEALIETARLKAKRPHAPVRDALWAGRAIDYDLYRRIAFREDSARWGDTGRYRLSA